MTKKKIAKKIGKKERTLNELYEEIKIYCVLNPCWLEITNHIKDTKEVEWVRHTELWQRKNYMDLFQLVQENVSIVVQKTEIKLKSDVYCTYSYKILSKKEKVILEKYIEEYGGLIEPISSTIQVKQWKLPSKNKIIKELLNRYYDLRIELKDLEKDRECHNPFYTHRFEQH